jgi:hypothetical protein
MQNNINKHELKESDEEEYESDEYNEEEYESDEEYNCKSLFKDLEIFKKMKYSDNKYLYIIPISYFLSMFDKIENFTENRSININRIKNLENMDFERCDPIILAHCENDITFDKNKLYIIDGQHRCYYIFNKGKGTFRGDEEIIIILYKINNKDDFIDIFEKTNNRMNFKVSQHNKFRLDAIKDGLIKNFNKDIFGKNRPKIDWNKFSTKLVNTSIYKEYETDADLILDKLIKLNENLANGRFTNEDNIKKYELKGKNSIYAKACKLRLFLAMDRTYNILDELDTMI